MGSGVICRGQLEGTTPAWKLPSDVATCRRRRRDSTAGLTFHVVNRARQTCVLFRERERLRSIRARPRRCGSASRVAVFVYCIMPNHWHFVLSPLADGALSGLHALADNDPRAALANSAERLRARGQCIKGDSRRLPVSDDRHFLWVCRYVERNPLTRGTRGTCRRTGAGPAFELLQTSRRRGWLSGPSNRPADWLTQVNTPQTEAELEAFRECA